MIRNALNKAAGTTPEEQSGFRWRGREVSRIEGFSDAVFGFAVTLLVVSLDPPRTLDGLYAVMRGMLPFAACFAILVQVWHEHYLYFRRYGLTDSAVVMMNAALLFVVLFYVYPLRFVFGLALGGDVKRAGVAAPPPLGAADIRSLFVIYGIGFAVLFLLLTFLYLYAWRRRTELELTPRERFETLAFAADHTGMMVIALASILMALTAPENLVGFSGFAYFAIGIEKTIFYGWLNASRRRRFGSAE